MHCVHCADAAHVHTSTSLMCLTRCHTLGVNSSIIACSPYTDKTWDQSKGKYTAPPFKGYPKDKADTKEEDEADSEFESDPLDMNDPDTGVKFASEDEKTVDPYVLFPLNVPENETTGTPETEGFVKLPAGALEPAFGSFWAADTPGWAPAPAPEAEAEAEDGMEDTFASVTPAFAG
jgi:hypothetical protein